MGRLIFTRSLTPLLILSSLNLSGASELWKKAIPAKLPDTWSYKGCYSDTPASRTLTGATYLSADKMTDEVCMSYCQGQGFSYAGTEYSAECYCDNQIQAIGTKQPEGNCNMACSGNATETCGGNGAISIFYSTYQFPPGPSTNPGVGLWTSLGCYNDSAAARTLTIGSPGIPGGQGAVTVSLCVQACSGYKYAGIEYGGECYCDDTFHNFGGPASDGSKGCNMGCNGNSSELCGGPNRLNVYAFNMTKVISTSSTSSSSTSATVIASSSTSGSTTVAVVVSSSLTSSSTTAAAVISSSSASISTSAILTSSSATTSAVIAPTTSSSSTTLVDVQTSTTPVTTSSQIATSTAVSTSSDAAPSTSFDLAVPGWNVVGCVTDTQAIRTLSNGMPVPGGASAMTIELCLTACQNAGYTLAGVEYSSECYCDNSYKNNGGLAPDGNTQCNMKCSGNPAEICGGPDRLNVFSFGQVAPPTTTRGPTTSSGVTAPTSIPASTSASSASSATATPTSIPGWTPVGCYTDSIQRTLVVNVGVAGGPAAMTNEVCTAACQAGGYKYAGTEYSQECWCGNVLSNGGALSTDGGCTYLCNGNKAEFCGGANRLTMFSFDALVSTTSLSPTSSIPITPIVSTSSSVGIVPTTSKQSSTVIIVTTTSVSKSPTGTGSAGTATNLPANWTYKGCFIDNFAGRIINYQQPDDPALTIEKCIAKCIGLGYSVAGVQYYTQCFCDNVIRNGGVVTVDTDCNQKCAGSTTEICGGGARNSVYSNGPLTSLAVPSNQKTGLPGNWKFIGCLTDGMNPRPLPYKIVRPTTNQASTCLSSCSKFGFPAGGLEYGVECYCGDLSDVAASTAALVTEAQCNMPCSGNATTLCGAGNLISYYNWVGTPLNTYTYPQGAAAGVYNLLVTGPVIPLITTLGLNNKVTVVEKSGTSPTKGSTGAYELDLFDNSFRTMHVQTDVFCSASLVLPDKVGRQINVGGWSGDSTYGVRLYWPDGSPGQPSVNDWQEDFTKISLQSGRWYPSAMVMVNGSILVVGGEDGSNGNVVPSIELLPKVGGTVHMDWLVNWQQYKLYPFLAVLPGGGIFVACYNEARILNEVTFATTATLPTIPGTVMAEVEGTPTEVQIGGRTYPLEGTMVLLPQRAPYTDPLTVLICGGGSPPGGIAIDNCVSIRPDVPGDQWVIEKMPTRRVMSCMTALPDGTYLIVNGAQAGTAGFGLATNPNHNVIIYDPSKPYNQRMTIMANATIDRLYHSEAILLQDGRVLISGSDPEDNIHLQEYRMETFSPPYITSGAARPSFTVANTNWALGGTYPVTVTIPSGNRANIRFSLIGADSSTHGNSMGQRTIFPAFTCTSTTACTITAPPNAHICPAGWFRLFVLDGPTPSWSKWVRIGGDPGNLGSWPNIPGTFTVPGPG